MGDLCFISIIIHPQILPCLELEIELLFFILLLCEIPVKGRHLDSFIWFLSTNDQFIGTLLAGILPILVLLLGGRELFLKSCSINYPNWNILLSRNNSLGQWVKNLFILNPLCPLEVVVFLFRLIFFYNVLLAIWYVQVWDVHVSHCYSVCHWYCYPDRNPKEGLINQLKGLNSDRSTFMSSKMAK